MNMIEKVAKALETLENETERPSFEQMARTAIEAMREPTEEMINGAHWSAQDGEWELRAAHEEHWQSMVDAALSGK